MASSYSPSLKIQLMANGEDSGTWGTITNTNWNLMEQAVTGVDTIVMANANYTLTNLNGVSDEARNIVIIATGTTGGAGKQIIAPLVPKFYIVYNNTSDGYAVNIGASTGSVITIPNGVTAQVYCDGSTGFYSAQTGSAGNFVVNGTLTATGIADAGSLSAGSLAVSGATTLSGVSKAPTVSSSDNSTNIATTAFVQSKVGTLGTMSTQNANSVAITGGSITGSYGLTAANATNAVNATYATTAGNGGVTSVNGQTGAVSVAPNIIYSGEISVNGTSSFFVDNAKTTVFWVYWGNGAGGNQYLYSGVYYGMGGLNSNRTWYGSGVDYQVAESGSFFFAYSPGNGTNLQLQPYGNNLGGYGAPGSAACLVMQF